MYTSFSNPNCLRIRVVAVEVQNMLILTFQALMYYNIVLPISVEMNQIQGWQKINQLSLGNGTKTIQILPMLALNYVGFYLKRIRKDVLYSLNGGGLVERQVEHDTKSLIVHNNSRHSSVHYLMRMVLSIEAFQDIKWYCEASCY